MDKRGQISIFIIVSIVIVVAIVVFFAVRNGLFEQAVSPEFQPIYTLYEGCIAQETENAVALLGAQGGRIESEPYVAGSDFAPFSSHLNFLGVSVPYWYYVAGNNIIAEYVPRKSEMEDAVSEYVREGIGNCDFSSFYSQGFSIEFADDVQVETTIADEHVSVAVRAPVSVLKEDRSARKSTHEVVYDSKIGTLYNTAQDIYGKQVTEGFLEEYGIDVLRSYAPVDGVLVQCSPEIWNTQEVASAIQEGLAANIAAIKFDGNYYDLNEQEDSYFVVDLAVDESVNLLYSAQWPTRIEVTPGSDAVMIAEPVGNQEGLGALGFCYVPYHFVYDVSFPVMVQVHEGTELFQFPLAVVIDNNQPRQASVVSSTSVTEGPDICSFKEGSVTVRTFDTALNPVAADVRYQCFEQACDLGKTTLVDGEARLETAIPRCVNGELVISADGFAEERERFSSNTQTIADVILDREYEVGVTLEIDGVASDDRAIVTFVREKENGGSESETVALPSDARIMLQEGQYEVSAYVYGDSAIALPATQRTECFSVSRGGLFGLFGSTKEECVVVSIPEQQLENALTGGGTTSSYLLASELTSGSIIIRADSIQTPRSIEDLQYSYQAFADSRIEVSFI